MGELWGRGPEQAIVDRLLGEAAGGRGSALVLWGDPGIGKSALLEYAVDQAEAFTVLRCRGTRTESALAFAALHELLWGLADRIEVLPAPQARALRGALGLSEDGADRFLIGAAVLTLLADLARERPVLIVADDGQWLDDASAQCLAFVARRLGTAPVALMLTAHDEPSFGPWDGLPALAVQGLPDDGAYQVVKEAGGTGALADRVVRAAEGNPLALVELVGTLDNDPAQSVPRRAAVGGGPPGRVAVGPRLRHAFRARIWRCSESARTLLLVVAAEDHGDLATLRPAAAQFGIGDDAWAEALDSGLLRTTGDRVEFRHPLICSAVYEDAPFTDREAVHRALADVLAGEEDRDRRAWHLASATLRPEEDVAALLEAVADRAYARGACMASARALERAADLSPSRGDGTARLARAAHAAWDAGDGSMARRLLSRSAARGPAELVARQSHGLRGRMEFFAGDQERAHQILREDAKLTGDPVLAGELERLAECAAWTSGLSDNLTLGEGPVDQLFEGQLTSLAMSWQWTAPVALTWGVEHTAKTAYVRTVTEMRGLGRVFQLLMVLPQLATVQIVLGEWDQAIANTAETLRLAEEAGAGNVAAQARNREGWVAAMRGDTQLARTLAEQVLANARPKSSRSQIAAAYWNLGLAALGADRPEEAFGRLSRMIASGHEARHLTFARLAAGDAIEAGVRTGQDVSRHLTLISDWAERTGTPWSAAMHHRCRALLADGQEAERLFQTALAVRGAAERPFEHARTQLLYGEWLRRHRRRADARSLLATAHETFDCLRARPWAERARVSAELTGASPAGHRPADPDTLTPQEQRVAQLAAQGLTNKEIAAQLYISPRTVGHHLSNIFAKLGLVTRAELAQVDFDNGMRLAT